MTRAQSAPGHCLRDAMTNKKANSEPFSRLSFASQFRIASLVILIAGAVVIGAWLTWQLKHGAVKRTAAIAAVYVESVIASQIKGPIVAGVLGQDDHDALDRIFIDGPMKRKVVRVKIWGSDGSVAYSSEDAQIGGNFPITGELAAAFGGSVQARISELDQPDNETERRRWPQLLEVYVPLRATPAGPVIAVAEFYHSMENLGQEIRQSQIIGVLVVAAGTLTMYLLLLGLVRRASNTILRQQNDLHRQVDELRGAVEEIERMRERLSKAGARTTALNEQFLHRVAADLHDGPAQDTALALMRFDSLAKGCPRCSDKGEICADLKTVNNALRSSLGEIRAIAQEIRMPQLEHLSIGAAAERAVSDFERRADKRISAEIGAKSAPGSLALKITLYRLIQEALANGWRHAEGSTQCVRVDALDDTVTVEISDDGAGFDVQAAADSGRMGLSFMRERVSLLGGEFDIVSSPESGTVVRASLKISSEMSTHV